MSLIQDENQWMDGRDRERESALSQVPAQCDCWPFASHRTMEKVQAAFEALWGDCGNGYGSPLERLIAEMQTSLDKANAGLDLQKGAR